MSNDEHQLSFLWGSAPWRPPQNRSVLVAIAYPGAIIRYAHEMIPPVGSLGTIGNSFEEQIAMEFAPRCIIAEQEQQGFASRVMARVRHGVQKL